MGSRVSLPPSSGINIYTVHTFAANLLLLFTGSIKLCIVYVYTHSHPSHPFAIHQSFCFVLYN